MGRGPFPRDEPRVAIHAGEAGVDRALKGDILMAFEAGAEGGRRLNPGGEDRRNRSGGEKDDDPELSSIQDPEPSLPADADDYLAGTGCLILSHAAAKSKAMPWGFSWHFRHCALMASGLPYRTSPFLTASALSFMMASFL